MKEGPPEKWVFIIIIGISKYPPYGLDQKCPLFHTREEKPFQILDKLSLERSSSDLHAKMQETSINTYNTSAHTSLEQ